MKLIISIICLLLVGCTVGPAYQAPDLTAQLPARYHALSTDAENIVSGDERWWEIFNDEAINQLVDTALTRNLDLMSADARIRLARAQLGVNSSATLPQLNAQGRISRDRISKNSEFLSNIPISDPEVNFTDYRAGFDASWEIDFFGRNRRASEAAEARVKSAEHEREIVSLRIAAEVVRHVIDYRAWQLRSKNAQSILDNQQRILDLRTLEEQSGQLSESELAESKTAVHQAAAAIPALQTATHASLMALTVLVDQAQEQVETVLQNGDAIPSAADQLNFVGLPSDLLQRRPDLLRAERELAAATADIGVAVAEQYPRFVLIGTGGLDSISLGKFAQLASTYWNIGPQFTLPIFSGGRLAAQVNAREAVRDAALANYRQAVLTALADTETALIRYQREQQRLTQIEMAVALQERQVELANTRYQAGESNFIQVLQTKNALAQLREPQLASQQALAEDLAALFKSLGGTIPLN